MLLISFIYSTYVPLLTIKEGTIDIILATDSVL